MVANPAPEREIPVYHPAADEDYMSDAQLAHFRQVLLEWKQGLLTEVDRTVNHMQDDFHQQGHYAVQAFFGWVEKIPERKL